MTLSRINETRLSNRAYVHLTSPSQRPVAVFIGGTSGIGEGMARVFAGHTNGDADIVIVGRNRERGEKILRELVKPVSGHTATATVEEPKRQFYHSDVSLLSSLPSLTQTILSSHPKINYLVLTTGFVSLAPRIETQEGVEDRLAVHYYARWKLIKDLSPAILKAREAGEEAGVMSVWAPDKAGDIGELRMRKDGDGTEYDWDLRDKGRWSLTRVVKVGRLYNNLMIESFSNLYPTIPYIHSHPGWVNTPISANSPSMLLRGGDHLKFLLKPWFVSIEECGEYMWKAMYKHAHAKGDTEGVGEGGAWRTGWYGDDVEKPTGDNKVEEDRVGRALWDYTEQVVENVLRSSFSTFSPRQPQ